MPIDPEQWLAAPPVETRQFVTPESAILYALGVGARDLEHVYEAGLKALPTMATVLTSVDPRLISSVSRMVHGDISLTIHAPIPINGEVRCTSRLGPIIDKGATKGALLYRTRALDDGAGLPIATIRDGLYLLGKGGFGGSSAGSIVPHSLPARPPDDIETVPTDPGQALLYRLSGDLNPIHVDPKAARDIGFDRPILHGLCTLGTVARALMRILADNWQDALRRLDVRFSAPIYPGETILAEVWREQPGQAAFRCTARERDIVVLDHGFIQYQQTGPSA